MDMYFVRSLVVLMMPCLALSQQPPVRTPDGTIAREPTDGTSRNAVNIGDSFLLRSLRQGDANAISQLNQLRHSVASPLQALFNVREPSHASDMFHLWQTLAVSRGLLPNTVASTNTQSQPWPARRNIPVASTIFTTSTPVLPEFSRFRARGNSNNRRILVDNESDQVKSEHVPVQNNRRPIHNRIISVQNTNGHINNSLVNIVRNALPPEDSNRLHHNNRLLRPEMEQRLNAIRSDINLRRNQPLLHGQANNGRLPSMLREVIQQRESISGETQRSPVSSSQGEAVNRTNASLPTTTDSDGISSFVRTVNTATDSSGTPDTDTSARLATAGSRDILMNHVLRQMNPVPLNVTEPSITSVKLGDLFPITAEEQSQSSGRRSINGNVPKDTSIREQNTATLNSFNRTTSGNQTLINALNTSQIVFNNVPTDNRPTLGQMETKPGFLIKDSINGNHTAFSRETTVSSLFVSHNDTSSTNVTGIHIVDMHVAEEGINIPVYEFVLQNVNDIVTEHGLVRSEYEEQLVGDTLLSLGIRQLPMLPVVTDRFHPKAEIVQAKSREEKVGDGKGVVVQHVGDVNITGGNDIILQYIGDIETSDGVTNILVPLNISGNDTAMTNDTNNTASTFTTVNVNMSAVDVQLNLTAPHSEERADGIPALVGPRLTVDSFDREPFEMAVFLGVTGNGYLSVLRDISKLLGFRGVNIHALDLTAKPVEFPVILMHLFNNQGRTNNTNATSVSDKTNIEHVPLQNSSSKSSSNDIVVEPSRPNIPETRSGQSILSTADQIRMWLGIDPVIHIKDEGRNRTESDSGLRNNNGLRNGNGNVRQRVLHASFG